jgi:hypothetical protein
MVTPAMALHTKFRRKLDQLWQRRTAQIRDLVQPKVGAPLAFTKRVRDRLIHELLDTATAILVRKVAKHEFQEAHSKRRLHRIKGRGLVKRGDDLVKFAQSLSGPIVYAFWRGKKCLYVGKGEKTSRLRGYQKAAYVREATCVEVFMINTKSQLPKAECLATHLFTPRDYKVRPAQTAWGKKCPVCRRHDKLRQKLLDLFAMR